MKRKPVKSSNIASVGHDKKTKTLEVEFKNGSIYLYKDFSLYMYKNFMKAESQGKYFNTKIRGQYTYEKLDQ